ncbi:MAG: cytochrome c oxidase subunit 3 [Chitinophagales bacterium]|jgi:cytochrome c oxidase subunit 3|nr:cytochrome c oxidase subunit 3 [Bacteroidota bacterium]MBK7567517.1 cytochrome c oxidase subunit 3 [Bacteroidota bacterium]MBP8916514.1 cytochrome c oxidase subunit 3 [Chitinophagales bacterium]MBP9219743.1 cytochrome c oxidase subunit 3 [Chitinophagales bacterium]MBP9794787.1 cytochrome c oxidase subunit 3 [Chitinophagales bacterium]
MSNLIHKRFIVHPYKFNMWIGITSMVMAFAAFTSAYVVKKGDVNVWNNIQLPPIFITSTVVIVVSSIFMHAAYLSFKTGRISLYRGFIILAFICGASFLTLQIQGWSQLFNSGVDLGSNVSNSFVYVITGAHFVHVLGGVIALLVFSVLSFTKYKIKNRSEGETPDKNNIVSVEVMMTYWHFVDILWVYLYFFLILNN